MDELAITVKESYQSEAVKRAQMAYAKETGHYEMLIETFRDWILQRRITTELIEPAIRQGRPKKGDPPGGFLGDIGWTRSRWHRRKKELAVSEDQVIEYLHICVEQSRAPSLYGMFREVSKVSRVVGDRCTCPICQNTHLRKV